MHRDDSLEKGVWDPGLEATEYGVHGKLLTSAGDLGSTVRTYIGYFGSSPPFPPVMLQL